VADGVATDLLPPALAKIQYVDCRAQDKSALVGLVRAFAALPPARPLPDPLPQVPGAPVSYLGSLGEEVQSVARLSFEQQTALVLRLKQGLKADGDAQSVRVLLQRFRARDDLYARVADEIDELLKAPDKPATTQTQPLPTADSPQTQWHNLPPAERPRIDTARVRTEAASARINRSNVDGVNAGEPPTVALTTGLLVAVGGVVIGYMFPGLVFASLNRSLRIAPLVFSASMILGLLPVLAVQLAILRKHGYQALASRWKWYVPAGWVIGAVAGGTVDTIFILVFGAAGGGVGALLVLTQAYIRARSETRKVSVVN